MTGSLGHGRSRGPMPGGGGDIYRKCLLTLIFLKNKTTHTKFTIEINIFKTISSQSNVPGNHNLMLYLTKFA